MSKIKAEFNGIKIIEELEENEFYDLDFEGAYMVRVDKNFKPTGMAIDGWGNFINPKDYIFNVEILGE